MTPTDFSVLLLAWDDADPSVAVLGGAALPPTLPLVYHLAAEQPVLAVFPHLPEERAAVIEQEPAALPTAAAEPVFEASNEAGKAAAPEAFAATGKAAPTAAASASQAFPEATGIRRLDATATYGPAAAFPSFLIGLADLASATDPAEIKSSLPAPATSSPGPIRSQWPTGANAPQHLRWSVPAAPYLGTSVPAVPPVIAPVPPLVPAPIIREAVDLAQAALNWPAGYSPLAGPASALVLAEPATEAAEDAVAAGATDDAPETEEGNEETSAGISPAAFAEITEEVGAAEANDLAAPEDNLTADAAPETRAAASTAPASTQTSTAPPLTARMPPLDGLNSRMIQYARQAAQLVRDRSDFGVIYAPNWPAWLAALEIRNSSRRPLVLYAASLAADFAGPAERGWLLEVERMVLHRAHLILVPDEQVRQHLHQHYGPNTGAVRVVPASDEAALQALLQELAAG